MNTPYAMNDEIRAPMPPAAGEGPRRRPSFWDMLQQYGSKRGGAVGAVSRMMPGQSEGVREGGDGGGLVGLMARLMMGGG